MIKPWLFYLLVIVVSCNQKQVPEEIIIEGNVKNVPDGKVYLADAHHWQEHLDSTEIRNGHFVFKIKPDSSFVPFKASIMFADSTSRTNWRSIVLRNHMRGPDSMRQGDSGFFLERGYTKIEGDIRSQPYPRVFAGKETDLMYRFHGGFGSPGNGDEKSKQQRLNYIHKIIKENPGSYFLLKEIYQSRGQYTKGEMEKTLATFNAEVRSSSLGKQISTYIANRLEAGEAYPALTLTNPQGEKENVIKKNAKLNMLVFWASWCGPCRKEIPALKEIEANYRGQGLNLVSISIDEDKQDWQAALQQEAMTWPQYVVDDSQRNLLLSKYNLAAVPLVVFTDASGKEVKRFVGYDKEQKQHYDALIIKYLNDGEGVTGFKKQ